MHALPVEAEALVGRIEALLAQAEPHLAAGTGSDEAAYALRETERRYLPDTLRAYLDLPPAHRDETATAMLIDQLRLLERATGQRLANVAQASKDALATNGAFLTERFGALDTLPEAPAVSGEGPPSLLVRRLFERIERDGPAEIDALFERAAQHISTAFPPITTVRRRGLLGRGPVASVVVDVPRQNDVLRYALGRTPTGTVDAGVTRYVRGVALRTERVSLGEWMQALVDDLGAYVERERSAREFLTRVFAR